MSRQLIGGENPPEGNATQVQVVDALRAKGIQAELSRPEFHYGHEKSIVIDAGTPAAQAMIADWNLQQSYFGPSKYGPVGARGFAVVAADPDDVATVASYFDANWPPFTDWPANTRASLVWSPSGEGFDPVGNGVESLTDFLTNATKTLDVYAVHPDDSFLLQTLIDQPTMEWSSASSPTPMARAPTSSTSCARQEPKSSSTPPTRWRPRQ